MSCIIYPQVKNKQGEFVDSELFKLLLSLTQDRELTKNLYAVFTDPNWLAENKYIANSSENYSWETDLNGEVTLNTISQFANLDSYTSNEAIIKKLQAPFNNKSFNSLKEVISEVIKFNEDNPLHIALVVTDNGNYKIKIDKRTDLGLRDSNKFINTNTLNNYLLNLLKLAGINVDIVNKINGRDTVRGAFNPLGYGQLANGFITMILLLYSEKGQLALPEEFSHLLIRALWNEPFILRAVKTIKNKDIIRNIMGEERFNNYNNLYKGNFEDLREEVLGKILTYHLTGLNKEGLNFDNFLQLNKGFYDRLIDFIKNIFNKLAGYETNIQKAIDSINTDFKEFSEAIKSGSMNEVISSIDAVDDIINPARRANKLPLLSVSRDTLTLELISNKALENLVKRYKIYLDRKKGISFGVEERKKIQALENSMATQLYVRGLTGFLQDATKWVNDSTKRMDKLYELRLNGTLTTSGQLKYVAMQLRDIRDFIGAYSDPLSMISNLSTAARRGELSIGQDVADILSNDANKVLGSMNDIMKDFDKISFEVVHNYFKDFFGENMIIPTGKNKGKEITLEMVLTKSEKDINFINRFLDSAADSGDILTTLFDKAIKASKFNVRMLTEKYVHRIRQAFNTLKEVHGIEGTSFMYEKDSNNIPTGYFISNRDYAKYELDRKAYENSLIEQGIEGDHFGRMLKDWEFKNTEEVEVNRDLGRFERMPKRELYPSDAVSKLSAPQREYYNAMMEMKEELDGMLPESRVNRYKAPQLRTDTTEAILSNLGNPLKAFKMAVESVKDDFLRREDDEDFGMLELYDEDKEYMSVPTHKDFRGNRIQRLPIYFTHMLKDKSRLSQDATAGLQAYASSAVDFNEMNKVVDILELARDVAREREINVTKGGKKFKESLEALGKRFQSDLMVKGSETLAMNRIDDLFSMQLYGEYKKDEGTLFGTKLDLAKTLDNITTYTSFATLGLNFFSGINNVAVGKFLMFLEGVAGEYFNLKDIAVGDKNYMATLPDLLNEIGSTKTTSKLALLREVYDVELNYDIDARHSEYYKKGIARVFGKASVMFLQNAGEHYMSTRTLLAYMNTVKLKDASGKIVSLFDAYEVEKIIVDGKIVDGHLKIKDGYTKEDGSKFGEEDIKDISYKVAKINQSLHGIYNRSDRAAIQKHSLGRMAMMFRNWMVPHYNRRYKGLYYDALMGHWKEGFYRTSFNFIGQLISDLKQGNVNIAAQWKDLNTNEKANIKRALSEVVFFASVAMLLAVLGDYKDKDTWAERMLLYQLKRLKLEIGVSVPGPMMITEAMTILQSPTAAMKTGLNIINVLSVWNLGHDIQSGKNKGRSLYEVDVERALPVISNLKKTYDLATEDYMFNIFK